MKLYHYSHPDRYDGIVTRQEGLTPETMIRNKKYVYALTDPQPESWLKIKVFLELYGTALS